VKLVSDRFLKDYRLSDFMVLCLLALPIFAILGIFSLKYRKLTKDSLECLFKTVTFRKCESGLDDRIRSDITGTFLNYSPKLAKFFYKHYKIISWIVLILFIWSIYSGGIGIYNYVTHGNCNGPNSGNFCLMGVAQKESVSLFDNMRNWYYTITGQEEKCSDLTLKK